MFQRAETEETGQKDSSFHELWQRLPAHEINPVRYIFHKNKIKSVISESFACGNLFLIYIPFFQRNRRGEDSERIHSSLVRNQYKLKNKSKSTSCFRLYKSTIDFTEVCLIWTLCWPKYSNLGFSFCLLGISKHRSSPKTFIENSKPILERLKADPSKHKANSLPSSRPQYY